MAKTHKSSLALTKPSGMKGELDRWRLFIPLRTETVANIPGNRIQRIDSLLTVWKSELVRGRSRLPERALDLFSVNPFWTVRALAERLDVAYTTAQRAINRLEALGAVSRIGDERRNRVYCAQAILDVLEENS